MFAAAFCNMHFIEITKVTRTASTEFCETQIKFRLTCFLVYLTLSELYKYHSEDSDIGGRVTLKWTLGK